MPFAAYFRALAGTTASVLLAACATSNPGSPNGGSGGAASTSGSPYNASTGVGTSSGADDISSPIIRSGSGGPAAVTTLVDSGRPQRCDDAGRCSCINIASLGKQGNFGGTTAALVNWLATESSAGVALIETKPVLDAAFLSNYDVIIVQSLVGWSFEPSEIAAFSDWIKNGGGVITLTGYADPSEVEPLNQLLSSTTISYNQDTIATSCPPSVSSSCYCWDETVPIGPWAPGPIGQSLTSIPAYNGHSINPGTATVDAQIGSTVYAAHEAVGLGHVFAWADEWVTYTSQWLPFDAGQYSGCEGKSAADVFQVPQFWYNAISYASLATPCVFTIQNPTIIIPPR